MLSSLAGAGQKQILIFALDEPRYPSAASQDQKEK